MTEQQPAARRAGAVAYAAQGLCFAALVTRIPTVQTTFSLDDGELALLLGLVPIVAGVGSMTHARFQMFNVAGGVLWVASLLYAGFFFGNIPFIRNNLTLVIFGIIGLSVAPVVLEFLRHRLRRA